MLNLNNNLIPNQPSANPANSTFEPPTLQIQRVTQLGKRALERPEELQETKIPAVVESSDPLDQLNSLIHRHANEELLNGECYKFQLSLIELNEPTRRTISAALLSMVLPGSRPDLEEACGRILPIYCCQCPKFVKAFASSLWTSLEFDFDLIPFLPLLRTRLIHRNPPNTSLSLSDDALLLAFLFCGVRFHQGKNPKVCDLLGEIYWKWDRWYDYAQAMGSAIKDGYYRSDFWKGEEGLLQWIMQYHYGIHYKPHFVLPMPILMDWARRATKSSIERDAPVQETLVYFRCLFHAEIVNPKRSEDLPLYISFLERHFVDAAPLIFKELIDCRWDQKEQMAFLDRLVSECFFDDLCVISNDLGCRKIPCKIGQRILNRIFASNWHIETWIESCRTISGSAAQLIGDFWSFKKGVIDFKERETLLKLLLRVLENGSTGLFFNSYLLDFLDFPLFWEELMAKANLKNITLDNLGIIALVWPELRLPSTFPLLPVENDDSIADMIVASYHWPDVYPFPSHNHSIFSGDLFDNDGENWIHCLLALYYRRRDPETLTAIVENWDRFILNSYWDSYEVFQRSCYFLALAICEEVAKTKKIPMEGFEDLFTNSLKFYAKEKSPLMCYRWILSIGQIVETAPQLFTQIKGNLSPLLDVARLAARTPEERQKYLNSLGSICEANPLLISRETLFKEIGASPIRFLNKAN